jgi:hypothetical protein
MPSLEVIEFAMSISARELSQLKKIDLAPEKRLPRLTVYYQLWRAWHVENGSGAIHA